MGLYNELLVTCPHCTSTVEVQVPEILTGFARYRLDPDELAARMTAAQMQKLRDYLVDEEVYCDACTQPFTPLSSPEQDLTAKKELARKLFRLPGDDAHAKRGPCGMRWHASDCDCGGAGGDR